MTGLVFEKVGPATSIQDIGRVGAQRYGLPGSGAMDRMALAIANTLIGQPHGAAAIEIGPFVTRLRAHNGDVRLALAGAVRTASIGDKAVLPQESFMLCDGETLDLLPARDGTFSYLAIEGGIAGEPVFGSLSVYARASLGSPFNRPFQPGDELDVQPARAERGEQRLPLERAEKAPIRIVLGPQDDYFTAPEIARFLAQDWIVSAASDRMGYRLAGEAIKHAAGFNIVSDGTVNGHIQIPGDGQPLVLLADRGTTGGYPKIAAIIGADLGRFAQIQANSTLRFTAISIEEAQLEARRFAKLVAELPGRLKPILGGRLTSEALLSVNLCGGMIHALDARSWAGFAETDGGL